MREWPSLTMVSTIWPSDGIDRERDHVHARDHDLVDALLAELEHAADHLLLLGLDGALLRAALDEDAQLLAGDGLVGARRARRAGA